MGDGMKCYPEEVLECAAIRALELGIRFDAHRQSQVATQCGRLDQTLQRILSHAQSCVRCSQLLELLQGTELELRSAMADRAAERRSVERDPRPRPLRVALEPIGLNLSEMDEASGDKQGPYALAADTDPAGAEDRAVGEEPVLSLASSDGRYLVRIFNCASGPGATAILLRSDVSEHKDRPTSPTLRTRVSLDIEGTEYVFSEKGIADLPRFPAQTISLIIRQD